MKYMTKLALIFENHGKRKALYHLRLMSERQLRDCGYSPELLREGVKGWPWRELPERIAPLKFDPALSLKTASSQNVQNETPAEKQILTQQDAA